METQRGKRKDKERVRRADGNDGRCEGEREPGAAGEREGE